MSESKAHPTSALSDWSPEDDVVVFAPTDHGTGIRQDDEVVNATELIHRFSSAGTGILLTPGDIAELRIRSKQDTWTTAQLADAEYEIRRNLLPALMYDRGNGRRLAGTLVMPLNADDGVHATDCEYIAFVSLEGTTAGSRVGRYGACRISPAALDRRGSVHTVGLNDRGYLDGRTVHPLMIDGFVKGYAHLDDAVEEADELRRALTTIRNANRAPVAPEENDFTDRSAPRDSGF